MYITLNLPGLSFFPGMNPTNGPQYWKLGLHDEQTVLAQAHVSL